MMRHVLGGSWIVVCLLGSYLAMQYDFTPGRLGPSRAGWPEDSELRRGPATTVVAFLHPRCVCTRATVKQLVRTLTAHPEARLIADVFIPPSKLDSPDWRDNDYVTMIRTALPQAHVFFDPGSAEAAHFGAMTSGTVLVYDAGGRELFRGGITDRRGGERDNPGLRRFAATLSGTAGAPTAPFPVFGCPLIRVADNQGRRS